MTLDELIGRANSGDVDSALSLGDYYSETGTVQFDDFKAIHWYEIAANIGSIKGTFNAMILWRNQASAYENAMKLAQAKDLWSHAAYWALTLITAKNFSEMNSKIQGVSWSVDDESTFGMAIGIYYADKDYEKVLKTINTPEPRPEIKYRILEGLSRSKMASNSKSFDELALAYNELHTLEQNSNYFNKDKATAEELLFVDAVAELSRCYQLGIPNHLSADWRHAQTLVLDALDVVRNDEWKKLLISALDEIHE